MIENKNGAKKSWEGRVDLTEAVAFEHLSENQDFVAVSVCAFHRPGRSQDIAVWISQSCIDTRKLRNFKITFHLICFKK